MKDKKVRVTKNTSKISNVKRYTLIEITILIFFISYTMLILFLACVPGERLPNNNPPSASLIFHFLEYFVFAAFLGLVIFHFTKIKPLLAVFIIGIGLSFLTEIIQIFVPGRCFGIEDIFANIAGLNTAIVLFFILKEYYPLGPPEYSEVF